MGSCKAYLLVTPEGWPVFQSLRQEAAAGYPTLSPSTSQVCTPHACMLASPGTCCRAHTAV